ncbi:YceI family protein [Parachitinimonas caeni]|uniref:YceI family protein n=1 Tax=Parachitinimonas caeni TaxID=3031301 RepID=A0ABT7DT22_9NEIS|nr:YceI family protein [Parachitinimonas caeni]MDK2123208.1 YceI family protein [Parachitinimonas caeni]
MQMFRFSLVAVSTMLAAGVALAAPETFDLDATHTYPSFEVSHLGFSNTRGFFTNSSGTLTLDREAKTGKVDVTIQTASLNTGFEKRDTHLRSKDFFNVEKFPTAQFKSETFKFDADKPVEAQGTLTMLGETKPVSLKIEQLKCAVRASDQKYICGAEVKATIKRTDWGMKYGVPFIGEEVKLNVQVEGARK